MSFSSWSQKDEDSICRWFAKLLIFLINLSSKNNNGVFIIKVKIIIKIGIQYSLHIRDLHIKSYFDIGIRKIVKIIKYFIFLYKLLPKSNHLSLIINLRSPYISYPERIHILKHYAIISLIRCIKISLIMITCFSATWMSSSLIHLFFFFILLFNWQTSFKAQSLPL
jgi:hypothetical protein